MLHYITQRNCWKSLSKSACSSSTHLDLRGLSIKASHLSMSSKSCNAKGHWGPLIPLMALLKEMVSLLTEFKLAQRQQIRWLLSYNCS